MAEANKLKLPKLNWREIPGWIAVVIGLSGLLLTYSEIRTANERELVIRVWDDVFKLLHTVQDRPGENTESKLSFEMRLLSRIHAHAGLLDNRSLKQAAFSVSHAWSVDHLKRTSDTRSKLEIEIGNMIEVMEGILGTYQPKDWPPANSPP